MSVINFLTRRAAPPAHVFYGQCGEDQAIFERYFQTKRNGTFLEMGALDGVRFSNTKFFEDTLGWSGVLIEPIPHNYEACCRQRPKSRVYNCIVSSSLEPMEIYVNGAISSVKDFTTQQFYDSWHKKANIGTIHVECRRLDDILHDAKLKSIDFWSLDVEGSEYEVLKTMDWDIPVHVLCMEITGGESADMNEACRDLLRQHEFRFDGPLAHNELWVGTPTRV